MIASTGIRFNDCYFSEPVNLASWTPPKCAGIYTLLIDDLNWAPKAYQPVYFGEFGNNSQAAAVLHDCGRIAAAITGKTIFASVLMMPFSTTRQRWALRSELIGAYNPLCQNDMGTLQAREAGLTAEPPASHTARRRIGFVA